MPQIVVLVFVSLALAYGQGQTLNTAQKSSLRVCVDVPGSMEFRDYNNLIDSLRDAAKEKHTPPAVDINSVPLLGKAPDGCDYIVRLGRVWTADNYNGKGGSSEVEFWLSRTVDHQVIVHYTADVSWNTYSGWKIEKKLMPIVAQRTLKAIEKDQRRPAKPSP
ncbi:MAG: hypothetical protein ACHP8B_15465 [Terriglobales bacterium]